MSSVAELHQKVTHCRRVLGSEKLVVTSVDEVASNRDDVDSSNFKSLDKEIRKRPVKTILT